MYLKIAGKFSEVLVRNGGHLVSTIKPAWPLDLITKFKRDGFLYHQNSHHQIFVKIESWCLCFTVIKPTLKALPFIHQGHTHWFKDGEISMSTMHGA